MKIVQFTQRMFDLISNHYPTLLDPIIIKDDGVFGDLYFRNKSISTYNLVVSDGGLSWFKLISTDKENRGGPSLELLLYYNTTKGNLFIIQENPLSDKSWFEFYKMGIGITSTFGNKYHTYDETVIIRTQTIDEVINME